MIPRDGWEVEGGRGKSESGGVQFNCFALCFRCLFVCFVRMLFDNLRIIFFFFFLALSACKTYFKVQNPTGLSSRQLMQKLYPPNWRHQKYTFAYICNV